MPIASQAWEAEVTRALGQPEQHNEILSLKTNTIYQEPSCFLQLIYAQWTESVSIIYMKTYTGCLLDETIYKNIRNL